MFFELKIILIHSDQQKNTKHISKYSNWISMDFFLTGENIVINIYVIFKTLEKYTIH